MRPQGKKKTRFKLSTLTLLFMSAAVIFTLVAALRSTFSHPGQPQLFSTPYLGKRGLQGTTSSPELKKIAADPPGDGVAVHTPVVAVVSPVIAPPCPQQLVVVADKPASKRLYHTITTAQGFANHWQARVHYYWFKRQREACQREPVCDMGGFTRLLHSGEPDDLMVEIPTVVVDHLPDTILKGSSYVVLNRPYAFLEWLKRTSIPEKYILMAESDHLFLRPIPNLMNGEAIGAALFTYIVPQTYPTVVRKHTGNITDEELKLVPQIGNSPTFVSVEGFRSLAPAWYNTTLAIFEDKESHEAWNWVLEMYGFALGVYNTHQHVNMKTYSNLLAHPPFDKKDVDYQGNPFYILHLTYPCRYTKDGNMTDKPEYLWQFDKRSYGDKPPPRNLEAPPAVVENDLVRTIITMINEATSRIPCWDDYVATSKASFTCAEAKVGLAGSSVS